MYDLLVIWFPFSKVTYWLKITCLVFVVGLSTTKRFIIVFLDKINIGHIYLNYQHYIRDKGRHLQFLQRQQQQISALITCTAYILWLTSSFKDSVHYHVTCTSIWSIKCAQLLTYLFSLLFFFHLHRVALFNWISFVFTVLTCKYLYTIIVWLFSTPLRSTFHCN